MKDASHGLAKGTIPLPSCHHHNAYFHKLAQAKITLHHLFFSYTSGFKVNR